jgi:hypothetical protein
VLLDRRRDALAREYRLRDLERAAYLYCDEIRSAAGVAGHLRRLWPGRAPPDAGVVAMLDDFVAHRLTISEGPLYLSLALVAPAAAAPLWLAA